MKLNLFLVRVRNFFVYNWVTLFMTALFVSVICIFILLTVNKVIAERKDNPFDRIDSSVLGAPDDIQIEGPYDIAGDGSKDGERGMIYVIKAYWVIGTKSNLEAYYGEED